MWNTELIWFEIALVSFLLLSGHIFYGHFEERTPKLRKFGKALTSLVLVVILSYFFRRVVALALFALLLIPLLNIHVLVAKTRSKWLDGIAEVQKL